VPDPLPFCDLSADPALPQDLHIKVLPVKILSFKTAVEPLEDKPSPGFYLGVCLAAKYVKSSARSGPGVPHHPVEQCKYVCPLRHPFSQQRSRGTLPLLAAFCFFFFPQASIHYSRSLPSLIGGAFFPKLALPRFRYLWERTSFPLLRKPSFFLQRQGLSDFPMLVHGINPHFPLFVCKICWDFRSNCWPPPDFPANADARNR